MEASTDGEQSHRMAKLWYYQMAYKTKSDCEKAGDIVKKGAAKAAQEEAKEAKP